MLSGSIVWTTFSLQFLQYLCYTTATASFDYDYFYGSGDHSIHHLNQDPCWSDRDCSVYTDLPKCCRDTHTCCNYEDAFKETFTPPPYAGVKIKCQSIYKYYTGVQCPKNDYSKIYCCYGGHDCCDINEMHKNRVHDDKPGQDSIEKPGVNSIGAIAGFVFLAVIVIGTLLTLATRYIKIKFRREHRRAPMHSREYIDAVNRRTNNTDENRNNDQGTIEDDQAPQVFYIRPETNDEDSDGEPPPPTYAEAIRSCPVLPEDEIGRRAPSETQNQPRLLPPSRSSSNTTNSIRLSALKDNTNTQTNSIRQTDEDIITLPKVEDSFV